MVRCRLPAGYQGVARRFFQRTGFEHVALLAADGALEAAPAMGCADIILDLVSTGGGSYRGMKASVKALCGC